MSYHPGGRFILAISLILIIVFIYKPRKQIFVYPRKTTRGKLMRLQSIVWIIALIGTIVRSFNIQRINGSMPVETPQNHVVFLLDGSLSMSADDVSPNRFSHATDIISRIATTSSGTDYSLIVFSGLPLVRIPRTKDISGMNEVVQNMELGDFPATDSFLGTALGDALLLSLQQLSQLSSQDNRAIIVISDGDSNKGYDPYKLLDILEAENIPVYFIAIGQEGYEVGKDSVGLSVITSFDSDLMQQFADKTDGKVYRNPDDSSIDELTNMLSQRSEESVTYIPHVISLNDFLYVPLLLLFVILFVFSISYFALIVRKS